VNCHSQSCFQISKESNVGVALTLLVWLVLLSLFPFAVASVVVSAFFAAVLVVVILLIAVAVVVMLLLSSLLVCSFHLSLCLMQ